MARRLGQATGRPATFPAPVGGLNARDSLADMSPKDAVIMTNWWPQPSRVSTRKGYRPWVTGLPGDVETIAEYAPQDGVNRVFAAVDGSIYDVTLAGPAGAPVVTGKNSDRWQDVSVSNAGGSFLYLFNGVDDPLLYNGTDWQAVNESSTPISITGVDPASLIQATVFKNRLFMVERNSTRIWYLPANNVGGAAEELDLGSVFSLGGHIVSVQNWTLDAGAGMDDHAVIISSEGEVAVYQGTDPENVATWSLVGVFYLGRPIGTRCATKLGGDLIVICEQGLFPLGKALLSASIDRRASIGDKIQNSINEAVNLYRNNFGWQVCLFPEQNALILNVPAGFAGNYQFCQNTITGAWTKFEGWDANVFRNTRQGLFFGSNGTVNQAWVGNVDGQAMIVADVLQAFNDFNSPALNKQFTLVRPYIQSDGNPSILYDVNGDYVAKDPTGVLTYQPPGGMIWGTMIWGEMVWGGSMRELSGWNTVGGIYKAVGLRLKVQSNQSSVDWASTNFYYTFGGLL